MMSDCYRFQEIITAEEDEGPGLLDNVVDATYVIHLEGNGRLDSVMEQIALYRPSSRIFIVYNQGYKRCEKPNWIHNTATDLVHANYEIFKHAAQAHYGNILVLEDDFFFSDKILDPVVQDDLVQFIQGLDGSPFMYALGCIPYVMIPCSTDGHHYYGIFVGMHSIIYSREYRDATIHNKHSSNIFDWDVYNTGAYMYYEPLCFQLFPVTENQKNWGYQNMFMRFIAYIGIYLMKSLQMDTKVDGYYTYYRLAKFVPYVILLIFLILFLIAASLFGIHPIRLKKKI